MFWRDRILRVRGDADTAVKKGSGLGDQGSGGNPSLVPGPWPLTPFVVLFVLAFAPRPPQDRPVLLFEETFEDIALARHGWYDLAEGTLASFTFQEHAPVG